MNDLNEAFVRYRRQWKTTVSFSQKSFMIYETILLRMERLRRDKINSINMWYLSLKKKLKYYK